MKTIEQTPIVSEEDKALLREMKKIVRSTVPDADVLLYGSVARGTQGSESDYDLLILTDEPLDKHERRGIEHQILDLELAKSVILSTIYHSKAEWRLRASLPFHDEVERHGIVL